MLRRLVPADYRVVPWRNGGGTTTEIVMEPEGLSVSDPSARFLFRVSIADVASSGPFSRFAGYDRHIVVISGEGMVLEGAPGGDILLARGTPRSFSGDADVGGRLLGGPVRDLNLMVDRERAVGGLEVRALAVAETCDPGTGGVAIVHVLEGELEGASDGDTLVFDAPHVLAPRAPTRLAVARVTRR